MNMLPHEYASLVNHKYNLGYTKEQFQNLDPESQRGIIKVTIEEIAKEKIAKEFPGYSKTKIINFGSSSVEIEFYREAGEKEILIDFSGYVEGIMISNTKQHNVFAVKEVIAIFRAIGEMIGEANEEGYDTFAYGATNEKRYSTYARFIPRIGGEIISDDGESKVTFMAIV